MRLQTQLLHVLLQPPSWMHAKHNNYYSLQIRVQVCGYHNYLGHVVVVRNSAFGYGSKAIATHQSHHTSTACSKQPCSIYYISPDIVYAFSSMQT